MGDFDTDDSDKARTLFCGNLHHSVTEDLLYELFLQGGPIQRVFIPKSKTGGHRNFGFITYFHPVSVPYAIEIFADTALFNRKLTLNPSSKAKHNERPDEKEPAQVDRSARTLRLFSNDALRQGIGGNAGPVNRTSYMEPTMNVNSLGSVMGNSFDPMMLLAMSANLLGGLTSALTMPVNSNDSNSRGDSNNDSLKMKNDRTYGNVSEPYNRRAHHSRHDRNQDNERERYDRGGRERRDNRNKNRR